MEGFGLRSQVSEISNLKLETVLLQFLPMRPDYTSNSLGKNDICCDNCPRDHHWTAVNAQLLSKIVNRSGATTKAARSARWRITTTSTSLSTCLSVKELYSTLDVLIVLPTTEMTGLIGCSVFTTLENPCRRLHEPMMKRSPIVPAFRYNARSAAEFGNMFDVPSMRLLVEMPFVLVEW